MPASATDLLSGLGKLLNLSCPPFSISNPDALFRQHQALLCWPHPVLFLPCSSVDLKMLHKRESETPGGEVPSQGHLTGQWERQNENQRLPSPQPRLYLLGYATVMGL